MDENFFTEMLWHVADNPLIFMAVIILTTFVLEDLAITLSAIIAAQGDINAYIPLSALLIGIVLGDIILYGLGRLSNKVKSLKKWKKTASLEKVNNILSKNLLYAVFVSRLIPGLRLPTYVAIGVFEICFFKFLGIVMVAVSLWVFGVFTLFYCFGDTADMIFGQYKWPGIAVLITTFILLPRLILYFKNDKKSAQ